LRRLNVYSILCKIPRHATGGDDDACRVLQLLQSKIRLNCVGVTSQSLIFRDHTLCKIPTPTHATGGDDDAYVLQRYCEDPPQFRRTLEYSTRIRSWISESRISYTKTNTGGGSGWRSPPPENANEELYRPDTPAR
jgi:hypothetical protein